MIDLFILSYYFSFACVNEEGCVNECYCEINFIKVVMAVEVRERKWKMGIEMDCHHLYNFLLN